MMSIPMSIQHNKLALQFEQVNLSVQTIQNVMKKQVGLKKNIQSKNPNIEPLLIAVEELNRNVDALKCAIDTLQ